MSNFKLAIKSGLIFEIIKLICLICIEISLIIQFQNFVPYIISIISLSVLILLQIICVIKHIRKYQDLVSELKSMNFILNSLKDFKEWKNAHPDTKDDWYLENVFKKQLEKEFSKNNGRDKL